MSKNNKALEIKKNIGPWIPFGFCVFLSGLVMFMMMNGRIENSYPSFFSFLPMTFFFVGVAIMQARKEIKKLSARIESLEKKINESPK